MKKKETEKKQEKKREEEEKLLRTLYPERRKDGTYPGTKRGRRED